MATTGRSPATAIPAAAVTACCSAMPTSRNRSGNSAWKGRRPGGTGRADDGPGEGIGVRRRRDRGRGGHGGGLHLEVVEALDVVLLGGGITTPLLGDHVDDDGSTPLRGVRQGLFHAGDVVAV